jgi:hypothetical protein
LKPELEQLAMDTWRAPKLVLRADAKNPIAPDATISLTIKTAEEKSGQVKFKK